MSRWPPTCTGSGRSARGGWSPTTRIWAHQSIHDPDHVATAKALQRERVGILRPVTEPQVEQRSLTDYDAALDSTSTVILTVILMVGWRDGRPRHPRQPCHRKAGPRDRSAEVAFLTRALKAPTLRESVTRLAERARTESWTHEEFLIACLHAGGLREGIPRR